MEKTKSPKLTPTIGIECHVQLSTKTKLFSAVSNDSRNAPPNTLISHIDLGMPGALPVLNQKVVELACKVGFAFNVRPQKHSFFERKHYFYPDLPKGYQITQLSQPIIKGGSITIEVDGQTKAVRLNRVQIEEDAGKNTHPLGKDYSLVDLNRAGTPLLEIVSEPDMHSAAEAKQYARELWLIMRYLNVSDADLYHGNMRFDVNVSLSARDELGTRTETKNLNSFRAVEKAVQYEIKRQAELLDRGEQVIQETRGWDEAKQKTVSQRGKEEAHDYRYMPDPDIPPLELEEAFLDQIKAQLPPLPGTWRKKLMQAGIDASQAEVLIDAEAESESISYLGLIEKAPQDQELLRNLANWFVNVEIPLRHGGSELASTLDDEQRLQLLIDIHALFKSEKLNSTKAKALITDILTSGAEPHNLEKYAEEQGYLQVSNESELTAIVKQVVAENVQAANDVKNGEMKAIGFLVGQIMKATHGKANPEIAQKLLRDELK